MFLYNKVNICETLFDYILCSVIYNNKLHLIYKCLKFNSMEVVYISLNLNNYIIDKYVIFKDCSHGYIIDNNVYVFCYNGIVYKYEIDLNDGTKVYNVTNFNNLKNYDYSNFDFHNFFVFKVDGDTYFLLNNIKELYIINITKSTKNKFRIKSRLVNYTNILVNYKIYVILSDSIFIYDFIFNKALEVSINSIISSHERDITFKKISDMSVMFVKNFKGMNKLFDFSTYNTMEYTNICKRVFGNDNVYVDDKLFYIINNSHYIENGVLYIITENNVNNYTVDDTLLNGKNYVTLRSSVSSKSESIPKNILLKRCKLFGDINNICSLMNNMFECTVFEDIDIYVNYIKTGVINDDSILKLFDICLYLQDIDIDYIAYYMVNIYMNSLQSYNNLSNIHIYINKLFYSKYEKQYYILLNNYLNDLPLNSYNEFIEECDSNLYKSIFKYLSRRFIKFNDI